MYCRRCGANVDVNATYCSNCGFQFDNKNNLHFKKNDSTVKNNVIVGVCVGLGIVFIFLLFIVIFGVNGSSYYFSDNGYVNSEEIEKNSNTSSDISETKKNTGKSIIVTDNIYAGVSISGVTDANKLISKDSTDQKENCPKEILQVENDIIKKYDITAVNLCEMDVDFAKELEDVIDVIYNNYPMARGHLTNLSLHNTSLSQPLVIAMFTPVFNFATSDSSSTYPWVIKTQVFLSSNYFLNRARLESSVKEASSSGHFPPNATTYSPVAHEFGHYLSFLALLNNYKVDSILLIDSNNINSFYKAFGDFGTGNFTLEMLKEAYNNYKNDTNTVLEFDEWRGTVSNYALAKDNNGNYIYDETMAEAFHDVYLNGDNASDASRYIVSVLKDKLKG